MADDGIADNEGLCWILRAKVPKRGVSGAKISSILAQPDLHYFLI